MGRESRAVWEKPVGRWRESGLSAREFASEGDARTVRIDARALGELLRGIPRGSDPTHVRVA
jgi:hypothetical protein